MTRIITIVVALGLGLLGLFMSVCGGGLLLSGGYGTLRNLFGAHRVPGGINELFQLIMPAGFLALGIVLCRSAYQTLRKSPKDE